MDQPEESDTSSFILDKSTGEIIGYVGRDSKVYHIRQEMICIAQDAPGSAHPFTVIMFKGNKKEPYLAAHVTAESIEKLRKEHHIFHQDDDGNIIGTH